MTDLPRTVPATPPAVAAVAQSRSRAGNRPGPEGTGVTALEGGPFRIGPRVLGAVRTRPYERRRDDPVYRPLRIFTLDPAASRLDGAIAVVNVPYEPLGPGPLGCLFRVDPTDGERVCRAVDLDAPTNLIRQGRAPSTTDPEFHQQMVYAVCSLVYATFRRALGRDIAWAFDAEDDQGQEQGLCRLLLRPHGGTMRNAYYDPKGGAIVFGYFADCATVGRQTVERGHVFTSLSHDIIAHEVTHALLDGLRARFTVPSGPDVLAFHEAFADLVALFQHFTYHTVVEAGLREARGDLAKADLLIGLARQFGMASGHGGALRKAIETLASNEEPPQYQTVGEEPHERGSILVSAVFEAFLTVFRRKAGRYIRLATRGSGVVVGELPPELLEVVAEEACQLAGQFLTICIRAIDYCPPVDLELGEYLRAVITADYELVPDDPHAYRETWIAAFRRRGIYPPEVPSLSEDALLWRGPPRPLPPVPALSFRELKFDGDPGRPADAGELLRQARALGGLVATPELMDLFGLVRPGDPRLGGDTVESPVIESIRPSRRIGPDGQILFDLVAEVTQRRIVHEPLGRVDFFGGATVIIDPRGEVRYVVSKSVLSTRRLDRLRRFVAEESGRPLWQAAHGRLLPRSEIFRVCHDRR
ncbi:peptidase M4 [Azospirillum argentinense]|uniref:Peptidase M4 n=1 Tax=Azospirillum brasilense TaxID=192 RepID=A0A4D8Q6H3_AZOBR|nr:peptidase M4 [Azospirillum argentinense]QCO03330.1 peptidase M4 [Azospirillum argentinense]